MRVILQVMKEIQRQCANLPRDQVSPTLQKIFVVLTYYLMFISNETHLTISKFKITSIKSNKNKDYENCIFHLFLIGVSNIKIMVNITCYIEFDLNYTKMLYNNMKLFAKITF